MNYGRYSKDTQMGIRFQQEKFSSGQIHLGVRWQKYGVPHGVVRP